MWKTHAFAKMSQTRRRNAAVRRARRDPRSTAAPVATSRSTSRSSIFHVRLTLLNARSDAEKRTAHPRDERRAPPRRRARPRAPRRGDVQRAPRRGVIVISIPYVSLRARDVVREPLRPRAHPSHPSRIRERRERRAQPSIPIHPSALERAVARAVFARAPSSRHRGGVGLTRGI